jgi:hypothetical protein
MTVVEGARSVTGGVAPPLRPRTVAYENRAHQWLIPVVPAHSQPAS